MNILFDENVPYKLAEGLKCLEHSNNSVFGKADILYPRLLGKEGIQDPEVIELAGQIQAVIITFDKDFKHIKSYYPLYKKYGVGVIYLQLPRKEANYWGMVKLIINKWEDIKEHLQDKIPPFASEVNKNGIKRVEF